MGCFAIITRGDASRFRTVALRFRIATLQQPASKATEGGGGGAQFVHGRSRMTIYPRIPTLPGRSTSGFHQSGRHCLHQARSYVRGGKVHCWGPYHCRVAHWGHSRERPGPSVLLRSFKLSCTLFSKFARFDSQRTGKATYSSTLCPDRIVRSNLVLRQQLS